jgi:hypothetical protein
MVHQDDSGAAGESMLYPKGPLDAVNDVAHETYVFASINESIIRVE